MRVVFFGTPLFAAHVLEYLLQHQVNIVAVISKPDRPKGRSGTPMPTPVKTVALAHNPPLPVFQPEIVSAPEFADTLKPFEADLFVVVAYGEIIKQHLLDMPPKACINLHASLLPKYRGAAPIQRCIINGETETGVTIMHMVKKMDAGDMISKVTVPIGPEMSFGELEEALCEAGKKALLDVIHSFEKEEPPHTPQDHSQATLAPKIELEDCEIDWNRSAQDIHNLVRGVNPYPGTWCYVLVKGEKKRLKISRTRIVPCDKIKSGTVLNVNQTKGNLLIATGDQALELLEVQLEGKKSMSSEELTRGIPRSQIHFNTISQALPNQDEKKI
jgi:methionyl-tRNA formyltransferase